MQQGQICFPKPLCQDVVFFSGGQFDESFISFGQQPLNNTMDTIFPSLFLIVESSILMLTRKSEVWSISDVLFLCL